MRRIVLSVLLSAALCAAARAGEAVATGFVFEDRNENGVRDAGERGLPDVCVSNGEDVVKTDASGRYELPVSDDCVIFVIKPRDWATAVDELNLPKFWYVHKPAGSPAHLKYPGVSPTGPLPESIDFPLYKSPEPDRFDVVVFGDPQPRNATEINYLAHDVVAEVVGVDAAFGVSLGDVMFDDLSLYPMYNRVISRIGIPWHNVHGNHDMNYDVDTDALADETWERTYGPPTYSFDYGNVHFIAIDNVTYQGQAERRYHCEFGRRLAFVDNDLKHVPEDKLVVLMMHIPPIEATDRLALFKRLSAFPHTLSLAAHWHKQQHFFLDRRHGWQREEPHHLLVHATACGSWWTGMPDENGIPHATMRDGAPNGYSIVTFDDNRYTIRFKAARRPDEYQMNIWLPDEVAQSALPQTEVVVNVFAGSPRSRVQMRIVERNGDWAPMQPATRPDPYYVALKKLEEDAAAPPPGRKLPRIEDSAHVWIAGLPDGLTPGPYTVEVRTTDMFGQTYTARRVFTVSE